jgi:leucine dehydrogenase
MAVFSNPDFDRHEELVFVSDPSVGLRAIIAVHSTVLGPALGGCRMYPYACEADALKDSLRLSRAMSHKAAIAGVRLGGGKSVVMADPRREKTEALLRSLGKAIDRLGGRYIAGEDIGTNPDDMRILHQETAAVSCLHAKDGGYGDPAGATALGVFQAIRAGLFHRTGRDEIAGTRVAIQGAGNVGARLARLLAEAGAVLTVCDAVEAAADGVARSCGARLVSPSEIYGADVDVFAPCAVGGTLSADTIPALKAGIVAGAANNQLDTPGCGEVLHERGILYLPDYVANGGGLISCAAEWYRTDPSRIHADVLAIYYKCLDILQFAEATGIPTSTAADRHAQALLAAAAAR